MKTTFIGAGSIVFARNLLGDILSYPSLASGTVSLMDIDPSRLAMTAGLARKLVAQERSGIRIEATTDLAEALRGADYVITMLQVGGLEAFALDVEIPRKYGVDQAVGDSMGPGGVFRALRTIPVFQQILRAMEERCPDALLLNYVNPMAMICGALNAVGTARAIGLCHSVQGTAEDLAGYLGLPFAEVTFRCAGINHMCWFLDYRWKGEDCYPRLRRAADDPAIYGQDMARFDLMRSFGAFVTESSYHTSEYYPYFRKTPEGAARINGIDSWLKEHGGSYYRECASLADGLDAETARLMEAPRIPLERSHEYAIQIINAMETGTPALVYGNVANTGCIENLPRGCTVEVPCMVDAGGILPAAMGELPGQLAALNLSNIAVQRLAIQGALERSREAVHHAIALDPLTSAVLTLPRIHEMVEELFEAESRYLPRFGA
jgi:alpha-galactosidase